MTKHVPSEHLWTEFNGYLDFEYDHSVYWPALNKIAEERREARKARWIAGGKHIGELEDYLNGALDHGVAPPADEEALPEPTAQPSAEDPAEQPTEEPVQEVTAAAAAPGVATKVEDLKVEDLKVEDKTEEATPVEAKGDEKKAGKEGE